MSPLRIGVLGASKIADRYTIAAMNAVDGVEPRAIAARDADRARDVAGRHGIPTVLGDYAAVVASPEVDAVYIPLPNSLHKHWALQALEAGKHVLSEKSLAAGFGDAHEIVAAAAERDLLVMENFMCEVHPRTLAVRDLIADGGLGRVHSLSLGFGFPEFPAGDQRNDPALAGGALNDAGAYCLDMASWYLGEPVAAVVARSVPGEHGVDAFGAGMAEFASGAVAHLDFGFGYDYRNEVRVWGSTGQLVVDRAFSIPPDLTPPVTLTRNTVAEALEFAPANQFEHQLARFAELVAGAAAGRERMRDRVLAHAAAMEAFRVSAREGRRVETREILESGSR